MGINTVSPLVCQENSLQNKAGFNKINIQNNKNVCLDRDKIRIKYSFSTEFFSQEYSEAL
jgi:hypothetical protein